MKRHGLSARVFAATTFFGSLAIAPFQCPHDPDPNQVREDTPGEALYALADEFKKSGDKDGQIRTLEYIVDKYPRSRFSFRARDDLKGLGVEMPAASMSVDLSREGVPMGRLPSDRSAAPSASASSPPSAPLGSASAAQAAKGAP